MEGFGGPSILSRGGGRPGQAGGRPVSFNFYAGIFATYETGSFPLGVNADGSLRAVNLYGGTANAGLTGSHAWKRSVLAVDYRGSYRKFSRHTYTDGSEQAIDLQYEIQTSRRTLLSLSEIGGTSTVAYSGLIAPTAILNPDLLGVPTNDIFDNRVYYLQSNATFSYRQTARLQYAFSGTGFMIRRSSRDLVGANGSRAGAQVSYQLTRRDQIGVAYTFMHFDFPRAFGASDLHGVSLQYGRRLASGVQLTLSGGAYRVESLGAEQVALSPEIAAILGQTTGVQAIYRVNYIPQILASIGYARKRSNFTASLSAGASPGNGVYLTSRSETAGFGYTYLGIRKVSLGLSAGVSRYSSVFQTLGLYQSYYGGGSASYLFSRHLSAVLQADARTINISNRNRIGTTVSLGIAWSPSELPIPSW